jgi:hypothetical protein
MRAPPVLLVATALVSALVAGLGTGCPKEEPFYSDEIGVEAIPVEPGAHAGTFALKTTNSTLIDVPGLDPLEGGGENFRLVQRTYDAENDVYEQRSELCGGFNYEVAGVVTEAPQATYRAVPSSENEQVKITAEGVYSSTGHLQLWALRDLPDELTTPLPENRDEAKESPWDDRIYDMDDDGEPGFSLVVGGDLGSGTVFAIQRKTVDLEGVVLGPDRAIGLAHNVNETLTLGASNPLIDRDSEGSARPNPNPKRSYFEEQRIDDDATCDDVMDAIEDGVLHELPPFD